MKKDTSKTVLAAFAHPDDESFGPGGTLALWAHSGAKIHLVTATHGEAGQSSISGNLSQIRSAELQEACDILGITSHEFLGFKDGGISNSDLAKLENVYSERIQRIKPDIVLTFDTNGVSGHLDHVAVALALTQAYKKTNHTCGLYYFTLPRGRVPTDAPSFIHHHEGRMPEEISLRIDVSSVWEKKLSAMKAHKSQEEDMRWTLTYWEDESKIECFIIKEK